MESIQAALGSHADTAETRQGSAMPYFLRLWTGYFATTVGSGILTFVLAAVAYRSAGTAGSYAAVILVAGLPQIVLGPVAGMLADRYGARAIFLIGNLGAIVGLGALAFWLAMGHTGQAGIYTGLAFSSSFAALLTPAIKVLVAETLPMKLYSRASGLIQLARAGQLSIAPALAALLMDAVSLTSFVVVQALLYFMSAVLALGSRVEPAGTGIRSDKAAGFGLGIGAFRVVPGLARLTMISAAMLFFVGLFQALFGPMVLAVADAKVLGVLQSVGGLGMLAGSLIISALGIQRRHREVLLAALIGMGLCFVGVAVSVLPVWIGVFSFLLSSTVPFIYASTDFMARTNIDTGQQGRVLGLISSMSYAGSALAYICGGVLADRIVGSLFDPGGLLASPIVDSVFGIRPGRGIAAIFSLCGIGLVLIAAAAYKSTALARLDSVSEK